MVTSANKETSSSGRSSTRYPQTSIITILIDGIQKTAFYRQLVPMESGVGWPIPLRKDGRVYIILPLFGIHKVKERDKTALFPLFATITLDWKTQKPVEYVDLSFRTNWPKETWEKEAGYFPFPETAPLTIGEYKEKRKKILNMYDEMFNLLAENRSFALGFKEEFSSLLRILMEPCLEKYYRALAPKFFNHFLPQETGE
ncbi:MAG: hypothetical protein K8S13_10170 [Desulfobacula sp.]|uniref:hypothetical protein n=1 Tax=Desulfobacula sp. TaxID=2593537 RepID=UPI0025B7C003|nr:hypothetical protein [Desulfobacula sp.]MCD4720207.1 hypothetical protein [Desulfobacula sp.]